MDAISETGKKFFKTVALLLDAAEVLETALSRPDAKEKLDELHAEARRAVRLVEDGPDEFGLLQIRPLAAGLRTPAIDEAPYDRP